MIADEAANAQRLIPRGMSPNLARLQVLGEEAGNAR